MRRQAGFYVVWGGRSAHGTTGPLRAWHIWVEVAFILAPFVDGTRFPLDERYGKVMNARGPDDERTMNGQAARCGLG